MTISLNDTVRVRLTDYGKTIYRAYTENISEFTHGYIQPSDAPTDEEGYSRFQLHDFMYLFGQYIFLGNEKVIDPIEMEVWTV